MDPGRERRVAHVVVNFGQFSQTFVRDAVRKLDERGWQAWVVSSRVDNRDLFPFPPDPRLVVARRPGPIGRRLHAVQRRSPWERLDWAGAIAKTQASLVHAHMGPAGMYALPAAQRLRLPLLVSFHGRDLTVMPREKRWGGGYPGLLARADRLTVVSRFLEGKLRGLGYDGPVDILPAGVPLERFRFRRETPATDQEIRALCIARQVAYKGVEVLLHALPAAIAEEPRLRVDIVGDGELREKNEALARRLGVAGTVTFHGGLAEARVSELLARAHMLVVPSRNGADGQAEGSPVVTKEALAAGVPIVSTDNGGLPETIPPPYRRELVAQDDPDALAAGIAALLTDREHWPERAAVGRAWVEQEFDWSRLAARTAAIYEEVLQRSRRQ